MANLKKLIHGQDVRFDTHQAGDAQPTNWRNVHLEKVLHEGGKIRFPLVGDFQPSWSSRVNDVQYERVKREVARELGKNPVLVQALAETVVNILNRFSSGTATIENAQEAAKKIAEYFGLDENFERTVEDFMGERLQEFISYHRDPDGIFLEEIRFTPKRVEIRKSRRKYRLYIDGRRR